eukprot:scaffold9465_cov50-Phaeocystis_antarctica.AAC.3
MPSMLATLEVSKLSGWLNADAPCRESKAGHAVRGEVYGSGAAGGGRPQRQAACRGARWWRERHARRGPDPRLGAWARAERTSNMLRISMTLEVSRLSGWLNLFAPCRESKGGHTVRGEVRTGRSGRRWATAGHAACRRARLQIWGRARGRAHEEHVEHARDAGGVEAQRLVERLRILPRVERRAYDAGGGVAREAGARQATAMHAACRGGLDCRQGAGRRARGGERTWNMPCMLVTLEVSKLSGWLNAGTPCSPCRESKRGHTVRCGVRSGWREAAGDRGARSTHRRGLDCRYEAGHGEERT